MGRRVTVALSWRGWTVLIVHKRIGPIRVGDALSKGARGELVNVFSTMDILFLRARRRDLIV